MDATQRKPPAINAEGAGFQGTQMAKIWENVKNCKKELVDSSSYEQIAQSSNAVSIDMELLQVGSEPVGMRCPYCQEDIMTRAVYRNTTVTHVMAVILGLFFWWLCCCVIPYVSKRWKDVHHSCPACRKYLGLYAGKSLL